MSLPKEESIAYEIIRSNGTLYKFPTNAELFRQEEPMQGVFLLDEGKVKMTRREYGGNPIIVEIDEPVRILGAISVLGQTPSVVTATTLTPCKIYSIPTRLFLNLTEQKADLTRSLLKLISQYASEQVVCRAQLGTTSSRNRLASLLLNYVSSGIRSKNGSIRINMPLKRVDIAGLLAVRPEQVSRLLAELKNKKVIELENGWIIVTDVEALIEETK